MKRLLFFLILIFPFTLYGETTMENFKNTPENRWQFFTDQVMGGKSFGKLNFICGSSDDLIPLRDRLEIKKRFKKLDPFGKRFSYVEIESADHGFMCEERDSFDEAASLIGWNLLMKEFN